MSDTGAANFTGQLTLGSTITNGSSTYTLPSATGTLALTSALSGYLPLSGGTLTGALGGTSASFSSTGRFIGALTIGTDFAQLLPISSSNYQLLVGSYYDGTNIIATATSGSRTVYNVGGMDFRTFTGATVGSSVTDISRFTIIASTGAATFSSSVTAGGSIAVGGTNISSLLTINGTAGTCHTTFREASTSIGFIGGANGIITGQNGKLALRGETGLVLSGQGNSPDMVLTGGNVLIGTTTNATGLLQVNGTIYATGFFESSSIKGKDIIATNPLLSLDIDVIKYTRKSDESKDIRYGYSAEQIHSLMPELTDKDVTAVKYLDVHTILISQLQKEIKELKAKFN
jgi:hypothetical protein